MFRFFPRHADIAKRIQAFGMESAQMRLDVPWPMLTGRSADEEEHGHESSVTGQGWTQGIRGAGVKQSTRVQALTSRYTCPDQFG
jgi:hypothetical protein